VYAPIRLALRGLLTIMLIPLLPFIVIGLFYEIVEAS